MRSVLRKHVASGLGVGKIGRHGLLAIDVFARFERRLEVRRMLEIRGGDEDRVHIVQLQQLFHVLEGARTAAIVLLASIGRAIAIDRLHKSHTAVSSKLIFVLELGSHAGKFRAAVADADMAHRNTVVGADDAAVGKRGRLNRRTQSDQRGCLFDKIPFGLAGLNFP